MIVTDHATFREINFNREKVYNALDRETKSKIKEAIQEAESLPHIQSIIITGGGDKSFCTGQDLNDRTVDASQTAVDLEDTLRNEWNPLIHSIENSSKIVIASLGGMAVGAGLSIALASDLVIASPKAYLMSGFTKIGLIPDAGSTFAITSALGKKRALDFFLFNKPIKADEGIELGLINEVADEPLARSKEIATNLGEMAPLSLRYLKLNINQAFKQISEDSIERETLAQGFLGKSADYQEGLQAFFNKRKPKFLGK